MSEGTADTGTNRCKRNWNQNHARQRDITRFVLQKKTGYIFVFKTDGIEKEEKGPSRKRSKREETKTHNGERVRMTLALNLPRKTSAVETSLFNSGINPPISNLIGGTRS